MDLITQGLLGAVVGQAGFCKTLGLRRASIWGAGIGMLPDIDVLAKLFTDNPMAEQLYHRGFTHSLFFAPLVAPIAAFLCNKIYPQTTKTAWLFLWFWALITHPLLDWFTTYGTQLLHPLTNHRFALDAVSVLDWHYSIVLLACLMISVFIKKHLNTITILASIALLLSTSYLFLGIVMHDNSIHFGQEMCKKQGLEIERIASFPEIGNVASRRITVKTPQDIRVMFFNAQSQTTGTWKIFPNSKQSPNPKFTEEVAIFQWFCDDWVWFDDSNHKLVLWDARFFNNDKFLWGIEVSGTKLMWTKTRITLEDLRKIFWP